MKRLAATALVLLMIVTLFAVPSEAGGRGGWNGGHGWHGKGCCWGGWWWPGAFVGGLALGAAVAATYPPYYAYPPPYYSAPPVVYAPAQTYTTAPAAPPAVQREVVYPHGKYVLYGDGASQPWQWVWISATPAPPPAPSPPAR